MSRPHQDQVIDDEDEESCPLCIEEFDPSDKGFFPCPCGFQICQFCHNKIKTTGNGLCPACRRTYEDKNIRIEAPNPDEISKFRAKQAKKKTAVKQKETSTREVDTLSRKHLAGIRVRRQNLVYVTGLRLNTSDPSISEKLRGEQFFGQYGKIDKIVVNKPKDSRSLQPVGVYITFFEKDAAALCILMVNGTQNAGSTIRADYGTTKYCSAYLRGETCTNRNCTFLHEPGEENESFTREDLSLLNAKSIEAGTSANPAAHTHSPPPRTGQTLPPVQVATHLMERQDSRDGTSSPVESSDGSALPSTVSWANRAMISRPASQAASLAAPSPMVSTALPVPVPLPIETPVTRSIEEPPQQNQPSAPPLLVDPAENEVPKPQARKARQTRSISPTSTSIRECLTSGTLSFVFDESIFANDADGRSLNFLRNFPPLFDSHGGVKRQLLKQRQLEKRRLENEQQVAAQALSVMEMEEPMERGSVQLGGTVEGGHELDTTQEHILRPQSQNTVSSLGHGIRPAPGLTNSGAPRSLQTGQYLLPDMDPGQQAYANQPLRGGGFPPASQSGVIGHTRQTSRFSFANDSATASTSVKPVGNPKLMSQQSSMMPPPQQSNQYMSSQAQSAHQFYGTAVQGPPPGLKPTGTPPVTGGGMFGQGHGFTAAGIGYGLNQNGRNANDDMIRELLRNRGGSPGSGRASDSGRHDMSESNMLQGRTPQGVGTGSGAYSTQGQNQGQGTRNPRSASLTPSNISIADSSQDPIFMFRMDDRPARSTPSLPPGLAIPPFTSRVSSFSGLSGMATTYIPETPIFAGLGDAPPAKTDDMKQELRAMESGAKLIIENILQYGDVEAEKPPEPPSLQTDDQDAFPALPKSNAIRQSKILPNKISQAFAGTSSKDAKNAGPLIKESEISEPLQKDRDSKAANAMPNLKRQHPGKLHIPMSANLVGTEAEPSLQSRPTTPAIGTKDMVETPSTTSRPQTPALPLETPVRRVTQPRTIRVLATPKADSTPSTATTPVTTTPASAFRPSPSTSKVPSRRPSVMSINIPGTPASDKPSDTVSVTTESLSRAESPPPLKVGSAPIKVKSKNQQRKERQERAKLAEQEVVDDVPILPVNDAVMHEPIIGRKKKSKKPAAPTPSASTPIESREDSHAIATKAKENPVTVSSDDQLNPNATAGAQEDDTNARVEQNDASATVDTPVNAKAPAPAVEDDKENTPAASMATPAELNVPSSIPLVAPESVKKALPLPAAVLADMVTSGHIDIALLNMFKPAAGGHRHDISLADLSSMAPPAPLTAEENAKLDAGKPVRRGGQEGRVASRVLITPLRTCLRGLSPEMEERYLELERSIMTTKASLKFNHRRDAMATTALMMEEMLKDIAAALTQPHHTSNTAAPATATATAAPSAGNTSRSGASRTTTYGDDALAYLNQFILPPLPTRGKANEMGATPSPYSPAVGSAIPRTYTTGDPTFSVFGVDVGSNSHHNPPTDHRTASAIAAGLADRAAALTSLGLDVEGADDPATIKKALANAVNGVIAASAAGGFKGLGRLGERELLDALEISKREYEKLEKRFNGLLKKNRKVAGL